MTDEDVRSALESERAANVELTKKIGRLNAAINELTQKAEPVSEARCPECGGACARRRNLDHFECPGEDCQWRGAGHEVWRRWGDTDKAAGVYWTGMSGSGEDNGIRRVTATVSPLKALFEDVWVIGPLPVPHAPGGE